METGVPRNEKLAPLAIPEEDDTTIDTQFIYWGYVNCCHTVANGKKVKKETWNTYWLELCGSTLRFYRDSSLHVESSLVPPPASPIYILEENEAKGAFFSLKNADVKVLSDGKFSHIFHRRSKRSVAPKVHRRHLFQLKLRQIHSTYIFQAASHSAMLRWVSKIQESLDSFEHVEKSESAEQRLKLARGIMRKQTTPHAQKEAAVEEEIDAAIDGPVDMGFVDIVDAHKHSNPNLKTLKNRLAVKREQIWQFEMQIIDFLGRGKGPFKRKEFVCTTKLDYLLVPGQLETFVPAGTNVTIFGQLPNRRWRCLVERDELLKSMNILINDIKNETESSIKIHIERPVSGCQKRDIKMLKNILNNLPEYPLIGCLPTSVLCMDFDKQNILAQDELSVSAQFMGNIDIASECLTDSDVDSLDSRRNSEISDQKIYPGSENTSEAENDFSDINDSVQLRAAGAGIVIRKKLRQKGISIIVGSSSSEGEEDEV